MESGSKDGGIIGMLGNAEGGHGWEAQNIGRQSDDPDGEHRLQNQTGIGKFRAEEPCTEGLGENKHNGTA